jgi:hypothetical protein
MFFFFGLNILYKVTAIVIVRHILNDKGNHKIFIITVTLYNFLFLIKLNTHLL